jgi:hypothetical protein
VSETPSIGDVPSRLSVSDEDLDVVVGAADLLVARLHLPAVEVYEKLDRVARTAGISLVEAARRLTRMLRHEPVPI